MTDHGYPDFLGFKERNLCDTALRRIGRALVEKKAQFLFGAGMSRDSGLPLGPDLTKTLLREFFANLEDEDTAPDETLDRLTREFPAEAIAHAVEKKPGCKREDLTAALKALLVEPQPQPHEAHRDFLSLLGVPPRIKSIFTTNYDELFELALGPDFATAITERNATELDQVRNAARIPVIHLRGRLDGDYLITEPDILTDRYQILMEEFRMTLHSADAFVFVGFSLNDVDFRKIYAEYLATLDLRPTTGKDTYFVAPATDRYSWALGSAIWTLRRAVWIPLDAKTFFARLRGTVESLALTEIRAEVEKKYGVKGRGLADLIESTAQLWRLSREDALVFLFEARTRVGGSK